MVFTLIEVVTAIVLGLTSGMFNYFLEFTFYEGNILDFYYDFLEEHIQPRSPKLAKVMGLCMICMGFWLSVFFFVLVNQMVHLQWVMIIPFMGVASFVTRKLLEEE